MMTHEQKQQRKVLSDAIRFWHHRVNRLTTRRWWFHVGQWLAGVWIVVILVTGLNHRLAAISVIVILILDPIISTLSGKIGYCEGQCNAYYIALHEHDQRYL